MIVVTRINLVSANCCTLIEDGYLQCFKDFQWFKLTGLLSRLLKQLIKTKSQSSTMSQMLFKKQKTCSVFLSSYSNTSGSLGEREVLWEQRPPANVSTAFSSRPNFHECFYNSIETRRTRFLFLENTATKKRRTTC